MTTLDTAAAQTASIRSQFRDVPLEISKQRFVPDPSFDDFASERLHRKQQLAAAFRVFARFGYNLGVAGHITARDPELPDHFWVNPLAVPFGRMRVSDLELVNHHGEIVIGDRPVNRAAFVIHSSVHMARPDVVAAAHAHAVHGKAWSVARPAARPDHPGRLPVLREPLAVRRLQRHRRRRRRGPAGRRRARPENKLVILRNHGFLTVGRSVEEAAWLFITADETARAQLLAEAAGTPVLIRDEIAAPMGKSRARGGFSFRPYFEEVVAEQPDLLD